MMSRRTISYRTKMIILSPIPALLWVTLVPGTIFMLHRSQTSSKTQIIGPDIQSVVSASIFSLQAENKLLVMTSKLNAVATSKWLSMGMTAQQTDIETADVQYFVDLSHLTPSNISVSSKAVELILPPGSLMINRLPIEQKQSYNNDSWLFSLGSDTKQTLDRANQTKIQERFESQSQSLKGQALVNAKLALTTLFEAPLRATGYTQSVRIVFL